MVQEATGKSNGEESPPNDGPSAPEPAEGANDIPPPTEDSPREQ